MYNHWFRMGSSWLTVVAVSVTLVNFGFSQPCTPSTCPPGPVMAVFQYSNCTGEIEYMYLSEEWNVCKNSSSQYGLSSYIDSFTNEYSESASYTGSDTCGDGALQATRTGERRYFGLLEPRRNLPHLSGECKSIVCLTSNA